MLTEEEQEVANWLGEDPEPGHFLASRHFGSAERADGGQVRVESLVKSEWLTRFPTGEEILSVVEIAIGSTSAPTVDELLLKRRELEYRVFQAVERAHVMPVLREGFADVDAFVDLANSVTNRRRSRSGQSLEHHLAAIFCDARLAFERGKTTEGKQRPDFLFPSAAVYHERDGGRGLFMLAAKTTCKDRWRQVLREAERIQTKHLFTLQEGVSEDQLAEMRGSGVHLVIPEPNRTCFPRRWRDWPLSLGAFVSQVAGSQKAT